jgi:hypothetical protein
MKTLILIAALLASSPTWGDCVIGNCSNGIGTFIWDNGQKYVGKWKDGEWHGQGTFTYSKGGMYIGEFKNNHQHGQGTRIYPGIGKYVGEWKESNRIGQGTYTSADGNYKYVGEFKGLQHGQGTETLGSGETKTGFWKKGSYCGTKAQCDAKEETATKAKEAREEARNKYQRIYNACLLDKSSDVDMQVNALRIAVEETCEGIAEEPSWYDNWKYN